MNCVVTIELTSSVASVEISVVASVVNTVVDRCLLVVAPIVVAISSVDISVGAKV